MFEKIKDLTAYDFEQGYQLGSVSEIKEILSAGFHIDSILKEKIHKQYEDKKAELKA